MLAAGPLSLRIPYFLMKPIPRRSFLQSTLVAAGSGLAATGLRPSTRAAPAGANDAIRVGIIGLGNKGLGHLKSCVRNKEVRVTAVCDVDPERVARALDTVKDSHLSPFGTMDARVLLDRDDVDAIFVATCNHWHALLTVWGCQAGKDVYVEKPMSHTVWEGRKMIEAAAKYRRIVQVGTQYRSGTGLAEGIQFIRDGQLGKLQYVHAVAYLRRGSIGRRLPWYPEGLSYDLFCGPAPMVPLERNKLHYDWHWMWDTGNGDLGNNGVHFLDLALRVAGQTLPPPRVLGLGARYTDPAGDVAEVPNAQVVVYDYPGAPVIYENRALPAKPGVDFMDQAGGVRIGVVAHCEGGYVSGLTGLAAHDRGGKVIRKFPSDGGAGHAANFFAAVRSRRARDLAAPVETGHTSAAVCHYGNISCRAGDPATPDQIMSALEPVTGAAEIGHSLLRHLGVHGIELTTRPLALGPWLELDASRDGIAGVQAGFDPRREFARHLLRQTQRPPYVIPEKV